MQKIIDLHCDTIGEIQAGVNIQRGNPGGHIDIKRLKSGNVTCQIFACFVSSVIPESRVFQETEILLQLIDHTCQAFSDHLLKVTTSAELENLSSGEKIGILPAVENGHAIASDLGKLEKLYQMGCRYLTLTHSKNLDWAASSGELRGAFSGLSSFGKKVIAAMNEMGMIVDISHVHESTFCDVVKSTRRPIIASHSNARQICPTNRNLDDDQIRAVADTGGMIGINFFPGFLDSKYEKELRVCCGDLFKRLNEIEKKYWNDPGQKTEAMHQMSADLQSRMDHVQVEVDRIIEHVLHIVNLVGADHVGFGSDFDGVPSLPLDIDGCDCFPLLQSLLKKSGISEQSMEKICRQNFIRVLKGNQ